MDKEVSRQTLLAVGLDSDNQICMQMEVAPQCSTLTLVFSPDEVRTLADQLCALALQAEVNANKKRGTIQ